MKVAQPGPTLCNPIDYTVHGILQGRILEWVAFTSSRGSFQPRSPTLQADSLPAEPPGKPKNSGVGSPSLCQRIFPTQEPNWSLLHCRQILYQLSSQGSHKIGLGLMLIPGDPKYSLAKLTVRIFLETNLTCMFMAVPSLQRSVWAFSSCGE